MTAIIFNKYSTTLLNKRSGGLFSKALRPKSKTQQSPAPNAKVKDAWHSCTDINLLTFIKTFTQNFS